MFTIQKFFCAISVVMISLLLANCSTKNYGVDTEKDLPALPFWPKAPDPMAYKYIMTIRNNLDVAKVTEDDYRNLLVGKNIQKVKIEDSYGVAAKQGTILITDRRKNLVHAFDIPKRRYFVFGYRLEGKLGSPLGISMDDQLNAYVVDAKYQRVVKYDRLGLYQKFIGSKDDFSKLTDVAVNHDGSLIAALDTGSIDNTSHRFIVFDAEGNKRFIIGKRGTQDGEFNLPNAITIAPDNTIYVLDAGNFRVQAFSPLGEFIQSYGSNGNGFGQFSRPKGITTDNVGNVYVSDASFGNVQVFNSKGQFLIAIGEKSLEDNPGGYQLPIGIAVDEKNYLYIADAIFDKLDVIKKVIEE